jgi:hypothetical protein
LSGEDALADAAGCGAEGAGRVYERWVVWRLASTVLLVRYADLFRHKHAAAADAARSPGCVSSMSLLVLEEQLSCRRVMSTLIAFKSSFEVVAPHMLFKVVLCAEGRAATSVVANEWSRSRMCCLVPFQRSLCDEAASACRYGALKLTAVGAAVGQRMSVRRSALRKELRADVASPIAGLDILGRREPVGIVLWLVVKRLGFGLGRHDRLLRCFPV